MTGILKKSKKRDMFSIIDQDAVTNQINVHGQDVEIYTTANVAINLKFENVDKF